ncbi:MAG: alpha-L-fucosidase [Phycisphaeraceae bacterium]|nr:alpha-L-fucosidase [Phycisphaeraceae bacterium]
MSLPYLPADVMERADWFVRDRLGMFIHWGLYAIPAVGEWVLKFSGLPYEEYRAFAKRFNPVQFDARQWVRIAQDAGMKYMVFTTKHHDGFCMFDNPHTEWKITRTPFGRDVTAELAEACHAAGMKLGFYHSLIDWMHPQYAICDNHPLWGDAKARAEKREHGQYIEYLHNSVRHLLTHYGQVDVLWLDFTPPMKTSEDWGAGELMAMVRKLMPKVLVNDRLDRHSGGNEAPKFPNDLSLAEQVLPSGPMTLQGRRRVWEACVTMNEHWGYAAADRSFKPTRALVRMLARCVGNGGNLLLNVGPDALGRIPKESVERLQQMGAWLGDQGQAIYGAGQEEELTPPPGCIYTRQGRRLFLHVLEWPYMWIRLPGLQGKLKFASLLRDGSKVGTIDWASTGQDVTLALPFDEPDGLDTVIELELG